MSTSGALDWTSWRTVVQDEARDREIAELIREDAEQVQPRLRQRQLWRFHKSARSQEAVNVALAIASHPHIPRRFASEAVQPYNLSVQSVLLGSPPRTLQQNIEILHAIIDNPATPVEALDRIYWAFRGTYPNIIRYLVDNPNASHHMIADLASVFRTGNAKLETVQTVVWVIDGVVRHPNLRKQSAKNLIAGTRHMLDTLDDPDMTPSDRTPRRSACLSLAAVMLEPEWRFAPLVDDVTRSRLVVFLATS